jgi:hypothetical protein
MIATSMWFSLKSTAGAVTFLTAFATTFAATTGAQSWSLSTRPTVVIGADADTMAEFSTIATAARLSSGEISVTTVRPAEIRLFSASGAFLKRLARPGGGPGELGVLWWVGRASDSLLTYDFTQARITVFDVPNNRVSTIPFAPTGAPARMVVLGFLGAGRWLLGTAPGPFPTAHANGPYRDSTTVVVWYPEREGMPVLGTYPNFGLFAHNGPRGTSFAFDRLSANTSIVPVGAEVWVGIPEQDVVLVLDDAGRVVRRIPVPLERSSFDASTISAERRRQLALAKDADDSARTAAMFDRDTRGQPTARFSRMFTGRDGNIWFEAFHPNRAAATEYVAVNRQGRVLGRMTGPPGVRFVDIGADYALGIRTDADDVETIVQYRINR